MTVTAPDVSVWWYPAAVAAAPSAIGVAVVAAIAATAFASSMAARRAFMWPTTIDSDSVTISSSSSDTLM